MTHNLLVVDDEPKLCDLLSSALSQNGVQVFTASTGLGLAKVYSIMESHDGSIECASEKDAGATFSLYIPAMGEDDEDSHDA